MASLHSVQQHNSRRPRSSASSAPSTFLSQRHRLCHCSHKANSAQPNDHAGFQEHMQQLEAVLPSMTCSQLASTGTSVRETFRAATLSTEAGGCGGGTQSLVDWFHSELPNQTWLLTYRAAVQQHLQRADCCTPEHLADILATVALMPVQVVQPLPIGFGTPRWSRPMAAADPAAWEQWIADLSVAYADLLAAQLRQQQRHHHSAAASEELLQRLAEFVISLACSMRWVNVNVDDDRLQTAAFQQQVVQCLQQQREEEQQQQQQPPQQPDQQAVYFGLAGSLAHRLTYTCLLMLLPPPRPMLAGFFAATSPSAFTLPQLQGIMRGMLYCGSSPPEPWLRELVQLVRGRVGVDLTQKELLAFVEAFRFFASDVGRPPWLRDVTALMEEFSCAG